MIQINVTLIINCVVYVTVIINFGVYDIKVIALNLWEEVKDLLSFEHNSQLKLMIMIGYKTFQSIIV